MKDGIMRGQKKGHHKICRISSLLGKQDAGFEFQMLYS